MDRNYYAEYYELEQNHWWFRARLQILKSRVQKTAGGRRNLSILNIGVATGATSVMLQEFGKVKSVEYDSECCEFVKQKLGIDIEQGSILDLKFENESFDLVCAFDVIEHVEDDKTAVLEMQRVCAHNGHVLVTVPAFMFLWSRHDEVNQHIRRYVKRSLCRLFAISGSIAFVSYFNSFFVFTHCCHAYMEQDFPFQAQRLWFRFRPHGRLIRG